jgi:ubiquinone/menaquinone biosynthesis C-methylase UbiE
MSIFDQMSLPEVYERYLAEPLFRPSAEEVLNRLDPTPDDSLLDDACGTGIVARVARLRLGPQARIVGVDAAPAMLAVARQGESTIDWREGNAMKLPIEDEQFTRISCHQGVQFFPNKLAAVRETHRLPATGGRVAIASWLSPADIPFAGDLHAVAERQPGTITDVRHSFGDASALARLLAEGGFRDVQVETVRHTVRGIDGPTYAQLNAMAIVGGAHAAGPKATSIWRRTDWMPRPRSPFSRRTPLGSQRMPSPTSSAWPGPDRVRRRRKPAAAPVAARAGAAGGGAVRVAEGDGRLR